MLPPMGEGREEDGERERLTDSRTKVWTEPDHQLAGGRDPRSILRLSPTTHHVPGALQDLALANSKQVLSNKANTLT